MPALDGVRVLDMTQYEGWHLVYAGAGVGSALTW